jgi:hypothetical protein
MVFLQARKLQAVQNAAAWLICNTPRFDHIPPLFYIILIGTRTKIESIRRHCITPSLLECESFCSISHAKNCQNLSVIIILDIHSHQPINYLPISNSLIIHEQISE